MPRIDPQQLLVCLTPLLAANGGIKSSGEVIRLANLMEKYSKKLVSKCIYIQILKCTETDLLGEFMAAGGWNLVHIWLRDGSESLNWAFVQELLEMLLLCPVDGNRLKSNHTPKIVKNLSLSCPQVTVKILSTRLVEQWLKIAHQEKQQLSATQTNGVNGSSTSPHTENNNKPLKDDSSNMSNENKVKDILHEKVNGELKPDEDSAKKQSKENIKYKVSNKEGGKLLLSLKRSSSPSADEKSAKVSRSSSQENKSKSSSSDRDKDKDRLKKSSSSSSSRKSGSSSSKSSRRDKERSSSTSSSHHKSSSSKDKSKDSSKSSSSKSSSSSSSRDKDKEKDRDKRKKDSEKSQAEKDKETLNLLAPLSSNKLQRIPKRQQSENSENKSSESNKDSLEPTLKVAKPAEPIEKKKPSISIEVRKGEKPKTVKTLNSQFRNHGLAEEPPKPPSRRDIKKPATTVAPLLLPTLPSGIPAVRVPTSPIHIKKLPLEKALDQEVQERVGGIKMIKPKPILIESIGFMDALSASAVSNKKDPKKRKRLTSNSKKDEPESPKIDIKPLKFYKDTLEESAEEQTNEEKSPTKEGDASRDGKEEKAGSPSSGDNHEKSNDNSMDGVKEGSKTPEPDSDEAEVEKRGPGIGCGPDGPPGVLVDPNQPRRKKRSIKWRSEEELTEIRYFELDETERTNVSKTFIEQKAMEHVGERTAFAMGRKRENEDNMAEQTVWRGLIIIENVPEINYGSKSREAIIQAEREKNVLQELYFRHSINDSPHEPDPESYEHLEPQIIPLDDVTGNPDSVNTYIDVQWPAPKGEMPVTSFANAFGNVFTNIQIPPVMGVSAALGLANPIVNPLANFGLGNPIVREPQNPILNQWIVPPAAFMQPPPTMIPQQGPQGFGNRAGMGNSNNYRTNNNNRSNNSGGGGGSGGGSWVRGNSRRGKCNQFQRTGFCRNKSCPYIHER